MAISRFIVAASTLLFVTSCGDIQTVLDPQEKNLDVAGLYERQFHSTLYFPKGEALHYPGYVLAIEKSPRNIVGGPVPANRIADPKAAYIQGERSQGLARSTKELIKLYEDDRKSLFVSHIIKYDQPTSSPHGKQENASKEVPPPRFIDQCFVYNAFESEPVDASGTPTQLNSVVAWPHCGTRATEAPESVHTLSASGAPSGELDITGTQFQQAGETALTEQGANSTADACRIVAERGDARYGAIASPSAGGQFGLNTIESNIEDFRGAYTRFLMLSRHFDAPTGDCKCMLAILPPSESRSVLAELTGAFARNRVNIFSIHSRPSKIAVGQYVFIITAAGTPMDGSTRKAVELLYDKGYRLKVLGAYAAPGDQVGPTAPYPSLPGLLSKQAFEAMVSGNREK
ncbi:prephenate dehydratase domain-containing protein [Paraburkholderia sp. BR14263]|uniref:prephenate dehydratase domain-containing protein n=1 Tax=unclassified Paraburkholderia TaxID=2615204 RepID=UPI0034CDF8D8